MTDFRQEGYTVASIANNIIILKDASSFLLYIDLPLLSDRVVTICSIFYNRIRVN